MTVRRTAGRAIRPFRRFAAWFALADEKAPPPAQAAAPTAAPQPSVDVDALIRKIESADATLATEVQRLAAEVARIRSENAAILSALNPPARAGEPAPSEAEGSTRRVSAAALERELERGPREAVLRKFAKYKEIIRGRSPVVDLCCGRGEFLECAEWVDITAYGVDNNAEAVAFCKELGLDARQEDPLQHLAGLETGSLGGVFCANLVEYLQPDALKALVSETARVLKPGGICILETLNPASLATLSAFWGDLERTRPLPAGTLSALVRGAGLEVQDVHIESAGEGAQQLAPLAANGSNAELVLQLNTLVGQLNDLLYGAPEYALVAEKRS